MDALTLVSTITRADWDAFCRDIARASEVRRDPGAAIGWLVAWAVGGALLFAALHRLDIRVEPLSLAAGAALAIVTFVVALRRQRRSLAPSEDGMVLGRVEYTFSADGVRHVRAHTDGMTRWAGVRAASSTDEYVYLWFDRIGAFQLPLRDLPPGISAGGLCEQFRLWAAAAGHDLPIGVTGRVAEDARAATDGGAGTPQSRAAVPGHSLRALPRLYAFRGEWPGPHAVDTLGIVALACAAIATWIALDRVANAPEPMFVPQIGATGIAWYLLVALLLAWVVSRLAAPPTRFGFGAWAIAAAAPAYLALDWYAANRLEGGAAVAVHVAAFAVGAALVARALRMYTGAFQPRAVLGALAALVLTGLLAENLFVSGSVWYSRDALEDDTETETTPAADEDVERVLFEQREKLDAALARVAPREPDRANAFFVGFAGVGEQRVFAEEIALAARVVGARYGSGSRTLLLVNDRRDLATNPLASAATLRHALRGIAAKMDVANDVLFLALSSHGSDAPSLSVSNGALPLRTLDGATLATALRESGIRWKVVIVSACHSGAFIAPLRDAGTIVLTAAAADRTSFGCSDERELTYFGEAFYRDALPVAADLRAAFEAARAAIGARERAEKIDASDPQASFADALLPRLAALDRGPQAASAPPLSSP